MKAVSTDALAHGPNWIHEVKWDGFRLVVTITDGRVVARTASGRDLTEALPEPEQMATSLGAEVILDGELVVPDATGRPDFSLVQRRFGRGVGDATGAATFVAFDLLHLGGRDTMGLELRDRRRILESLWVSGEAWTLSPWYEADGREEIETPQWDFVRADWRRLPG